MYNDNFDCAINNLEAFWEREDFGRPAMSIYAPKNDNDYRKPYNLEEQWMDPDFRYNRFKYHCENSYFGGEFLPTYFVNFGPGSLSPCIGGSFELSPTTIWLDTKKIIEDWENPPDFKLDRNSVIWQKTIEVTEKFLADKNMITSMTDLGGICDIIASLRGTENLIYDLYDYPDEVKAAINRIDDLWKEAFDELNAIISQKQEYFTSWIGIASKKPWFPIQCDFSAMLSPALFEEFVLPSLVKHANHLPRSIYHLDGITEIPHLDMILDIERLNGIQWVPGAGKPDVTSSEWFPLYKRIQEKGKNLVLLEADPAGIENLLNNIDRKGVFIFAKTKNREEADELIKNSEKWSKSI